MILHGWGSIVGLLGVAIIGAGLESMTGSRATSYALAGAALFAFGLYLSAVDEGRHTLFWIPIGWWGLAIGIGALVGL